MTFFDILAKKISAKDSLHANYLNHFFRDQDDDYFKIASNYLEIYCNFLIDAYKVDLDYIVDSYLSLVYDVLVEQTRFMRKGSYRYSTLKEAEENVYSNREFMFKYMIGVALTTFFWKQHYEMFVFFKKAISLSQYGSYLEIGCGHGLYFIDAIKAGKHAKYQAYDLSETSIDVTEQLIKYTFGEKPDNVTLNLKDILEVNEAEKYNFITMGEVLEHVEEPQALLERVYSFLADGGIFYLTTCANAPVIDHIYLFNSADEIRLMIKNAGFIVQEELIINTGQMSIKNSKTVDIINYAARLTK